MTVKDARAGLSILHAFEDQDVLVRPLAAEVVRLGGCVRFDDLALRGGDSLTARLESLKEDPRVGVVVLSPAFLREGWTTEDLDTLSLRLSIDEPRGGSLVLPLWHQLKRADVAERSPALADKLALKTSADLTALAAELYKLMDRFVPCKYCESLIPKPGNLFEDRICDDCDRRAACGHL